MSQMEGGRGRQQLEAVGSAASTHGFADSAQQRGKRFASGTWIPQAGLCICCSSGSLTLFVCMPGDALPPPMPRTSTGSGQQASAAQESPSIDVTEPAAPTQTATLPGSIPLPTPSGGEMASRRAERATSFTGLRVVQQKCVVKVVSVLAFL